MMCELVLHVMMEERGRMKVKSSHRHSCRHSSENRAEKMRRINKVQEDVKIQVLCWSFFGPLLLFCFCLRASHNDWKCDELCSRAQKGSITVLQRPLLVSEITVIVLTLIYLCKPPFKFNVIEMISLNSDSTTLGSAGLV